MLHWRAMVEGFQLEGFPSDLTWNWLWWATRMGSYLNLLKLFLTLYFIISETSIVKLTFEVEWFFGEQQKYFNPDSWTKILSTDRGGLLVFWSAAKEELLPSDLTPIGCFQTASVTSEVTSVASTFIGFPTYWTRLQDKGVKTPPSSSPKTQRCRYVRPLSSMFIQGVCLGLFQNNLMIKILVTI